MTPAAPEPLVSCPDRSWRGEWPNGYAVIVQATDHTRVGTYRVELDVEYQGAYVCTQSVDLLSTTSREQFHIGMAARNGLAPVAWEAMLTDFYRNLRATQATAPEADPWAKAVTVQTFCQQDDTDDLMATVKDFVVPGCITVVAAPRGSGKSFVALFIGVALAQGGLFRMEHLAHHRVLLVDRDNSQALVRQRLRSLGAEQLTTFKVLTREIAPPLTNREAWAKFPAEDYDVVIVDSISAFTEGVSEKEGKQTQEFIATLKDLASRGLGILALANTTKAGTNIRGRGEQTDAVDIVYEARNITGWEPEDGPCWWESLPEAGEQAWQQNTTRQLHGGALRIGFVPTKFRLAISPEPFVLEMNTTTTPWSMADVTTQLTQAGLQAVKAKRTAERQKLDGAALALQAELRARPATPVMRKCEAEDFLRGQGLKVRQARNILENGYNRDVFPEGYWLLREIRGEKGSPVGVYLVDPSGAHPVGSNNHVENNKVRKSAHQNSDPGVLILDSGSPGSVENATSTKPSITAGATAPDFRHKPASPCRKSEPSTPADIQAETGGVLFSTSPHHPAERGQNPHEISAEDFEGVRGGSTPIDAGTRQRTPAPGLGEVTRCPNGQPHTWIGTDAGRLCSRCNTQEGTV